MFGGVWGLSQNADTANAWEGGGMFLNVDLLTLEKGGIGEHRSRVKMIKMIIKSGFPPPTPAPYPTLFKERPYVS